MSEKSVFTYDGQQCDVKWDGRLCIHVGECTRASGELFESGRKPWCMPDLTTVDQVTEVVGRCPTGALTVENNDGAIIETPDDTNVVVVSNDGPNYLRGDLDIEGAPDDMPGVKFRAALCRCGASKNKPFCDNSHRAAGFRDGGAVGRTGSDVEGTGGKLSVRPLPNGPVLLNGNFTIVAASGREAFTGTKAALCRCGASKTKPFCDGTHNTIGFTAD